ncbi:lipoprotein [Leptospira licerasiae]|uniref:Lipoprotein n=1 Tax=Leptospira licerasiae str. MMD4847 TaxID=1049971 RepID=A0ABN0H9E4_9LEPT|nr:lipoprotein [Leptospira licerasiae]EJZ42337.1 putative lipoprotein [Leptospira licerasiae str. MMD4847]
MRTNNSISYFLIFLVLLSTSCSSYQTAKVRFSSEIIEAKNPSERFPNIRRIAINRIQTKPNSFATFAGENFTNNLRFYLLKEGIEAQVQEVPIETKHPTQTTSETVGNTISPSPSATPTMFSSNFVLETSDKPIELKPEVIQKVCALAKCDIYVDGYIYEKRLGNILDEEITTGIFIRMYSQNGTLLGQLKLSSPVTTEIFSNNSILAEMMASKIAITVGVSNKTGFKWKFWE